MNTKDLSTLKINKLTQAQYDRELAAGRIDEDALYLTPDTDYTNTQIDTMLDQKANNTLVSIESGKEASGLMSVADKKKLNAISGYYGTSSTAAATQTKEIICDTYPTVGKGTTIFIKFANGQEYDGAIKLKINNSTYTTTGAYKYYWNAGEVVGFTYDGSNFVMHETGVASTSFYGMTKLVDSVASTSTSYAATPNSVKKAYDKAKGAETALADYKKSVSSTYLTKTDASTTYETIANVSNAIAGANTYTDEAIAALIDSAPEELNTLKEIATEIDKIYDALENDDTGIGDLVLNKADKAELEAHIAATDGEGTAKTSIHVTSAEKTKWNNAAPTAHAAKASTYGVGTNILYGHLKLSDRADGTDGTENAVVLDVNHGTAATPKAVKTVYDLAKSVELGLEEKADKKAGVYYVEGTGTTDGKWTGSNPAITAYYEGLTIAFYINDSGVSGGTTLNINGLGAVRIWRNASSLTTHLAKQTIVLLVYSEATGTPTWHWADYDSTVYTAALCTTAAGTAAKAANCNNYALTAKTYTHVTIRYANTSKTALTLNINKQGAKPIYINGTASSDLNYTLPAGTYITYYDGSNYYFRTDGYLPGPGSYDLNIKKLDKTTYEYNKELALGGSGKVCIGKFPMYDSNITVNINSTTSTTYHATLVIATQNINTSRGGSYTATVYGDEDNKLTNTIQVHYSTGSNIFSVYINLPGWSKNLLHIQAVSLAGEPTNIATLVDAIPKVADSDKVAIVNANATAISSAVSTHAAIKSTSSASGHVTLSDSVASTSDASAGVASTPKAAKTAYDKAVSVEAALANYQGEVGRTYLPLSGGTITGNLAVNGTSNLVGATTVGGALTVNNNGTITGNVVLNTNENNTTTIKGKTSIASTLEVAKTAEFSQNVKVETELNVGQDIVTTAGTVKSKEVLIDNVVTLKYNATKKSLDFIFN